MRIAVIAVTVAVLAQQASAADAPFPVLRGTQTYEIGPPPVFRWEGVYGGVQVGGNSAHVDFQDATKSIVGFALRQSTLEAERKVSEWPVLGGEHTRSASFGGFIGYNAQFEDVVVGIEGNYNHTAFSTSQADSLTRVSTTADGTTYTTRVTASALMSIKDYATLRARAGWAIGPFLPYAMMGFAFGTADITRTAIVDGIQQAPTVDPNPPPAPASFGPWGSTESKTAYIYGYSAGAGLDFALTKNIFIRGEYEYVKFSPTLGVKAEINSARVGAGLKF
jgi:opacity protein-like surface antigen